MNNSRVDLGHAKRRDDSRDKLRDRTCGGLGYDDQSKYPEFVVCDGGLERAKQGQSLLVLDTSVLL